MRRRRRWGLKQSFYRLCSKHRDHVEGCSMCAAGMWHYDFAMKFESWLHDNYYNLWFRWANRRWFNSTVNFLEEQFPNMRGKRR